MPDIKLPLTVLAIDPATTISGWSILSLVSLDPLQIVVRDHGVIDGNKLAKRNKELSQKFQRQFCVLDALYHEYCDLIVKYSPDEIVSECAFGYKHMSAFMALTLAIHSLRRAARDTIGKDIHEVPPTISKKALADTGGADKPMMREAYFRVPFLIKPDCPDISEHEIDSVGHGTGYIRRDIIGDVVQVSAKDKKRKK